MSNKLTNLTSCQTAVISGAEFSECGKYRYSLTIIWDNNKPQVMFVMLNPSTVKDDPTIRRCIRFAKSWGYGGLNVVNLFAYRTDNLNQLLSADDPVGNLTDQEASFRFMSDLSEIVVCAWGNNRIAFCHVFNILRKKGYNPIEWIDKPLYCLKTTKWQMCSHPLYLNKCLKPVPYKVPKWFIKH